MNRKTTRRTFIKRSAALGAAAWIGGKSVWSQEGPINGGSSLERLNVACIGVGGRGSGDTTNAQKWGANIVGLCDIQADRLEKTLNRQLGGMRRQLGRSADSMNQASKAIKDVAHVMEKRNPVNTGARAARQLRQGLRWRMRRLTKRVGRG